MHRDDKQMVIGMIVIVALIAAAMVFYSDKAEAHYYDGCKKAPCKVHVLNPFKRSFLGPVGACESGTGSHNLKVGLKAVSPGGKYRGRYQFDLRSWAGAGGKGDPISWGWIEQAYRAVVWLHRHSRGAWPNC